MTSGTNTFMVSNTKTQVQVQSNGDKYKCSLCMNYFVDPVIIDDGGVYCRQCITEWKKNSSYSPGTGGKDWRMDNTGQYVDRPRIGDPVSCPLLNELSLFFLINTDLNLIKLIDYKPTEQMNQDQGCEIMEWIDIENNHRLVEKTDNIALFARIFANVTLMKNVINALCDSQWVGMDEWEISHYVCRFGSLDLITHCINTQKINFNARIAKQQLTPVHLIFGQSNALPSSDVVKIIKLFVDNKVNIDVVDNNGDKPIHLVFRKSNNLKSKDQLEVLKIFLENKIDINQPGQNEMYPVHYILGNLNKFNSHDQLAAISMLFDYKSKGHQIDLNKKNNNGNHPLDNFFMGNHQMNSQDSGSVIQIIVDDLINPVKKLDLKLDMSSIINFVFDSVRMDSHNKFKIIKSLMSIGALDNGEKTIDRILRLGLVSQDLLEFVKAMIKDGGNIEMMLPSQGVKLIHYILQGRLNSQEILEFVKFLIAKKLINWSSVNIRTGEYIAHILCSQANALNSADQYELIKLMIAQKISLEVLNGEKMTPIHHICGRDNWLNSGDQLSAIKLLIDNKVNLNIMNLRTNWAPIHYVCSSRNRMNAVDQLKALELLVTHGVKLDITNNDRMLPIHYICGDNNNFTSREQVIAIKLFIDKCLDFNATSYNDMTGVSLIFSNNNKLTSNDQLEIIKLLIKKKLVDLNNRNNQAITMAPVHYICSDRNRLYSEHIVECIKLLAEQKVNFDVKNDSGIYPIHYISGSQNKFTNSEHQLEALKILVDHGVNINRENNNGVSALQLVCGYDTKLNGQWQLEAIKLLVDKGATLTVSENNRQTMVDRYGDITIGNTIGINQPIHLVCSNMNHMNSGDQLEAIKLLVGKKVNLETYCRNRWLPIHYVCSRNNNMTSGHQLEAIKLLVSQGIDLNKPNSIDWRPIHQICSNQNRLNSKDQLEAIRLLIDKKVDIDKHVQGGMKPFHYLCGTNNSMESKDLAIAIRMFVEYGAVTNVQARNEIRAIDYLLDGETNLKGADLAECTELILDKMYNRPNGAEQNIIIDLGNPGVQGQRIWVQGRLG